MSLENQNRDHGRYALDPRGEGPKLVSEVAPVVVYEDGCSYCGNHIDATAVGGRCGPCIDLNLHVPEEGSDEGAGPCETDDCDNDTEPCVCGAAHCSAHPHDDDDDDDDYVSDSTAAEEEQCVTDEILERYPTATRWEVKTTDEYDDGYFYDESEVRVTYVGPDGKTVRADRLDRKASVRTANFAGRGAWY